MAKSGVLIASIAAAAVLFAGCSAMLPYKENFSCEKGAGEGLCGSVVDVYDETNNMDEYRHNQYLKSQRGKAKKSRSDKGEDLAQQIAAQKAQKQAQIDKELLQEMVEAVEIRNIQNVTPTIFKIYQGNQVALKDKAPVKRSGGYVNKKPSKINAKPDSAKKAQAAKKKAEEQKSLAQAKNKWDQTGDNKQYGLVNPNNAMAGAGGAMAAANMPANQMPMLAPANAANNAPVNEPACGADSDNEVFFKKEVEVCAAFANIRSTPNPNGEIIKVADKGEKLEAAFEQGGWIKLKDGNYVFKDVVVAR